MQSALDELVDRLDGMTKEEFLAAVAPAVAVQGARKWVPNPGPQSEAFYCKADVLLYGGQAAGGKTDLLGGLALIRNEPKVGLPASPVFAIL